MKKKVLPEGDETAVVGATMLGFLSLSAQSNRSRPIQRKPPGQGVLGKEKEAKRRRGSYSKNTHEGRKTGN